MIHPKDRLPLVAKRTLPAWVDWLAVVGGFTSVAITSLRVVSRGTSPRFSEWYGIVVMTLIAAAASQRLYLKSRARRMTDRIDAGQCPACGYDLRGLDADRCPECGGVNVAKRKSAVAD